VAFSSFGAAFISNFSTSAPTFNVYDVVSGSNSGSNPSGVTSNVFSALSDDFDGSSVVINEVFIYPIPPL